MPALLAFVVAALQLSSRPALAGPPAALLGPDGPTWVGPFPPVAGGSQAPELVVDPLSGDIWVSQWDAPGARRVWAGWGWTIDGEAIDSSAPPETGARYEFTDGRLSAVESPTGKRLRYRYDAAGRIAGLVEVGGAAIDIAYDDRGRVVSLQGPGRAQWRLEWSDRLVVRDSFGRPFTITRVGRDGAPEPGIEVRDATGRLATTLLGTDGPGAEAESRVVGWRDPRGLVTRLRPIRGGVEVLDGAGRSWRLSLDDARRVTAAQDPAGHRWEWSWDAAGRLASATDPDGRTVQWSRDEAGRITAVGRGGESTRLVRDPDGRVIEIVDGTGSRTRMLRDRKGRVSDIIDAVGNTLAITRESDGTPTTVVERTGARWTLGLDLLGRIARIVDPTRRELVLQRDGSGAVVTLEDSVFGEVRVDRGARGSITRVVDAAGRTTGFLRDAVDRVSSVIRADGSVVELVRDAAGDVVAVVVGDQEFTITRDPSGLPMAAGDVSWRRGGRGEVSSVEAPGIELWLLRDAAGRLRRLQAGRWWLAIERDRAGRPVHWSGTDGDLLLTRDRAGRRIAEEGGNAVTVVRDPRGFVSSIQTPRGSWRWMGDATGRPLQVEGPDGLAVGLDRDDAGRVSLVRHPGGALARRSWEGDVVTEQMRNVAGEVVFAGRLAADQAGRTSWTERVGGSRTTWRYGPLGQQVAIETDEGAVWSWTMDVVAGPEGEVIVLDRDGRLAEAKPPIGPAAWGVSRAALTVFRDQLGRIERLGGDIGSGEVRYDPLGRLASVRAGALGTWSVGYDPLGRLAWVDHDDLGTDTLLWGPDAVAGEVVLASGIELSTAWVYGPTGPVGRADGGAIAALLVDAGGSPRALLPDGQAAVPVRRTPMGWIDPWIGQATVSGGVQAWAGGPILRGRVALDPVSGQRVDGRVPWPWVESLVPAEQASDPLDPDLWAPESPWHDPLALLDALGVIRPIGEQDGAWAIELPSDPDDRAAPWLPASLEGGEPPLGPRPGALPLDEDPVTNALIAALLPGAGPPAPELLAHVLLDGVAALPPLPPDLPVPGAEALR